MAYLIRDLIKLSDQDLCQLPREYEILFEDGVSQTVKRNETRYSRLFWPIFDGYENTVITSKHHVHHHLNGKRLNADTHRSLCTEMLKSIVNHYQLLTPVSKEYILEHIYRVMSDAMKALTVMTEESVVSLDILDFIRIARDPTILSYREEAMKDTRKIRYAYDNIMKHIETDPKFKNNGLAIAVKAKMVKVNQVVQCVGFRGFSTEVDGTIFSKPIWSNYTEGNRGFYEMVSDSRTAAKSHFYSDSALCDSEYHSRRLQLYAVVLERVNFTDCGSTKLCPWTINPEVIDETGVKVYGGDLPNLVGKYYVTDPTSADYKVLDGSEKHLIGERIYFRTILGCRDPDHHCTCHICLGALSHNVNRFTNLGHLGVVTNTKELTQNILSIKHVNMSSTVAKITLGEHEKRYMNGGLEMDGFYLNKPSRGTELYLSILRDEASGLQDIDKQRDLEHISLSRITSTSVAKIILIRKGFKDEALVSVKQRLNNSMLSRDMIHYLCEVGWDVDDDSNFRFDMSKWDFNKPVFILQSKEDSFVDLANEVQTLVQSSQKDYNLRSEFNSPFILLQNLFDTVNRKFNINIASMEALIYGLTVKSPTDASLGRGSDKPVLGVANSLTIHRSLGPAMTYQSHESALFDPLYFFKGTRPDSVMDVFLRPKEVTDVYPESSQL